MQFEPHRAEEVRRAGARRRPGQALARRPLPRTLSARSDDGSRRRRRHAGDRDELVEDRRALCRGARRARQRDARDRAARRARMASCCATSAIPIPTARASISPTSSRARWSGEIAQWRTIKKAASDAIVANGGTISHHHGVGEDHLPWMRAGERRARHRRAARDQAGARSQGHPQSGEAYSGVST